MTLEQYLQILLLLQVSATNSDDSCNIVYDEHKHCLMKELLLMIDHSVNQLAVDRKKNVLYLGIDHGAGKFTPAMLNLENKKLTLLPSIRDAHAIAVDDETGDVYFGGKEGIFRYRGPQKTQKLHLNQGVRWIVLRGFIYFIQIADSKAYVFRKKNIVNYQQLENVVMKQFVFDASRNVYFINKTGLYKAPRYVNVIRVIKKSNDFLAMVTNHNGEVFVSASDGIYYIKGLTLVKYTSIPGVLAMTYDRFHHLIYSDSKQLIRLVPMSNKNGEHLDNIILVR